MNHRHGILDRDGLRAGRLDIDLGPPEARQDQRITSVDQVAAVQFRRDMDGEVEISQGRLRRLPIGNCCRKIAARSR